ncbi:hypothetical protein Sjap_016215 [Stephania japonica]|uniref:Uncharacterized protein n=1 Tax=Stephania japonica TaxID=461633 RepID=A0AAP0IKP8_9MAGN
MHLSSREKESPLHLTGIGVKEHGLLARHARRVVENRLEACTGLGGVPKCIGNLGPSQLAVHLSSFLGEHNNDHEVVDRSPKVWTVTGSEDGGGNGPGWRVSHECEWEGGDREGKREESETERGDGRRGRERVV